MKLTNKQKLELKALKQEGDSIGVHILSLPLGDVTIAWYRNHWGSKMITVATSYYTHESDKFRAKTGAYFALKRMFGTDHEFLHSESIQLPFGNKSYKEIIFELESRFGV